MNLNHPIVFAEPQYLPILIANGADVNARNVRGETRLIIAAHQLDDDTAQVLLEHGAQPQLKDATGRTALMIVESIKERMVDAATTHADAFIVQLNKHGAGE